MSEFNFIILVVFLVLFIIFIVNRILKKRIIERKDIIVDEKFSENLNNLDVIVDGVSLKEIEDEDNNQELDDDEIVEPDETDSVDNNEKKPVTSVSKKQNLKNLIISKEILERRKKLE